MKIAIGSDHGGYALKTRLVELLNEKGATVEDMGCDSLESVDYPDYYRIGQPALTADDRRLVYPVYLNTTDPNSPRKTKNATLKVICQQ